jgi:hypothetical protein
VGRWEEERRATAAALGSGCGLMGMRGIGRSDFGWGRPTRGVVGDGGTGGSARGQAEGESRSPRGRPSGRSQTHFFSTSFFYHSLGSCPYVATGIQLFITQYTKHIIKII